MKKPHPFIPSRVGRKRRTLGWTLLTLGMLVAGVWVASGWWGWQSRGQWWHWTVQEGTLTRSPNVAAYGWDVNRASIESTKGNSRFFRVHAPLWNWHKGRIDWYDQWFDNPPTTPGFSVTFWPIPLLLCIPAARLPRSGIVARRRAITGKCRKCGYDLVGLAKDAPCPECGKEAITT